MCVVIHHSCTLMHVFRYVFVWIYFYLTAQGFNNSVFHSTTHSTPIKEGKDRKSKEERSRGALISHHQSSPWSVLGVSVHLKKMTMSL